jgi:hypothetical protein
MAEQGLGGSEMGGMEDWATRGESLAFFAKQVGMALLYVVCLVAGGLLVAWCACCGRCKPGFSKERPDE